MEREPDLMEPQIRNPSWPALLCLSLFCWRPCSNTGCQRHDQLGQRPVFILHSAFFVLVCSPDLATTAQIGAVPLTTVNAVELEGLERGAEGQDRGTDLFLSQAA